MRTQSLLAGLMMTVITVAAGPGAWAAEAGSSGVGAAAVGGSASTAASGAAAELEPNATISLEFPDLPKTYLAQKTGQKVMPQLTFKLPANYTASGKFPLFVFLSGGDGGPADKSTVGGSRAMIGDTDYICVSLPLFKKEYDPKSQATAKLPPEAASQMDPAILEKLKKIPTQGIVTAGDYEVISGDYGVMLKKLNEVVPNIDPDKSVLAGFSNGAHTIGVLLARQDEAVLRQFHSFAMIEGGLDFVLAGKAGLTEALKKHRYIIFFSDTGRDSPDQAALRPIVYGWAKGFAAQATAGGFDFSFVTMHSGHSFGPADKPTLAKWARGETVAEAATPGPGSSAATASSATAGVATSSSATPAAVQKALELPEGAERLKALVAAAVEWQEKEPQAALEWAVGLPKGPSNYQTLNRVSQAWGNREPKAALACAMSLDPKGNNSAMAALHLIVTAWARADAPAALAWAEKQTRADLHFTAYFSVADGWAQKDPAPAAAWAAKLADEKDRHLAVGEVAHVWTWTPSFAKNPEAAMAWVEKLPAGELKMAAGTIADGLARKDKDAAKATAWVEGLPLTAEEKAEIVKKLPNKK